MTFEYNGVNIHLIDTPGFNDTIRSDGEVLLMIATYFSAMYNSKIRLDGIVYKFPITSRRMSGSAIKELKIFSKLVGDEALSEVVLVTSMWDLEDSSEAEGREKELRERFWKHLIEKGSKVCRVDHRRLMALPVLDVLLRGAEAQGKVLQIQRELVDDMKTLDETEVGRQLSKEIQELQKSFRRNLEELKASLTMPLRQETLIWRSICARSKLGPSDESHKRRMRAERSKSVSNSWYGKRSLREHL